MFQKIRNHFGKFLVFAANLILMGVAFLLIKNSDELKKNQESENALDEAEENSIENASLESAIPISETGLANDETVAPEPVVALPVPEMTEPPAPAQEAAPTPVVTKPAAIPAPTTVAPAPKPAVKPDKKTKTS